MIAHLVWVFAELRKVGVAWAVTNGRQQIATFGDDNVDFFDIDIDDLAGPWVSVVHVMAKMIN